ncbi:MAG: hypothetical protein HY017_15165 [Betaproteobacteria bacterium]|nr:hypothetical protein [Betaproteobacteria bacterium]
MRIGLKVLVTPVLMTVAALLMFIEEVLWEAMKRIMAAIGRLPLIHGLEARVAGLPPYGAAAVFLLPGALLLPVKIAALWLMAQGHVVLGIELIVSAKLVGTALVARIFILTRPSLTTLAWFAAMYEWIMRWRGVLYGWVKASAAWRRIEATRAAWRAWYAKWKPGRFGRRFRAIRRLQRRAA